MEKYAILLGYFDKQWVLVRKLYDQLMHVNVSAYESRYVFALKTQQFYTALEDLLKQIAKGFENHIEDLSSSHKELLMRLNTDIPEIRPSVLSKESFLLLDKIRAFRYFIRHAYDCELLESELALIQNKLKAQFHIVEADFTAFRQYISSLTG